MPKFKVGEYVKIKENASFPLDVLSKNNATYVIKGIPPVSDGFEFYIIMEYNPFGAPVSSTVVPVNVIEKAEIECLYPSKELMSECESTIKPTTVSILGTTYTIIEKPLKHCDGYCDKTTKEIAVATKEDDCDFGDFEQHRKKVLRHEIIHAYHHESGLAESFENKQYGFGETVVDWFAIQSPKIFKTFEELDIL